MRTEVDGVRTFWLPLPGPRRVALQFRVGQSHESLARRGITHLVEHLAFSSLADRDHEKNGFVDEQRTVFWASGSEDEVSGFLRDVSATISRIPADRVATERRILSVEASRRGPSLAGSMLSWRFGPTGVGLLGYEELGLRWLEVDQVQAWAAETFTRQNAVLWMSGPPPAGLELRLPSGSRMGWAVSRRAEVPLPYCLRQDTRLTGVGLLVDRDVASQSLVRIAERRLHSRLRQDLGVAYEVSGGYARVDAETAHVVMAADSLPEQAGEVLREMVAILNELGTTGPSDAEVQRDIEMVRRIRNDESASLGWLDAYAISALFGEAEPKSPGEVEAEIEAAAGSHHSRMARFLDTALAIVNRSADPPGDPFITTEVWSTGQVSGQTFLPNGPDSGRRLLIGPDGVSLVISEEKRVTVHFDQAPGCLWWGDGSRLLYGEDGFMLRVAPWEWRDGPSAIALIDAAADEASRVPMGDGTGPPPAPSRPPAVPPAKTAFQRGLRVAGWMLWVLMSLMMVALALMPPQTTTKGPYDVTIELDCGSRSSIGVVLRGLPPTVTGPERGPCSSQATGSTMAGGLGVASVAFACWVGWRWVGRRRARKEADRTRTAP